MIAFQSMTKEVVMPEEFIAGNPKKGAELVADCAACHGQNGIGLSSDWPNLAGQNQKYLYDQLKYIQKSVGAVPSPFDCWLVIMGLKTLHLRMHRRKSFLHV